MMPLWTTTMRSLQSRCGWAFSSVGRPCVAQRVWPRPYLPLIGDLGDDGFEVGQLAGAAPDVEAVAVDDGDARRVVAAIFEAAQSLDEDWDDRLVADVSDDSAHIVSGRL